MTQVLLVSLLGTGEKDLPPFYTHLPFSNVNHLHSLSLPSAEQTPSLSSQDVHQALITSVASAELSPVILCLFSTGQVDWDGEGHHRDLEAFQ